MSTINRVADAGGWLTDLENITYDSVSLSVSAQDGTPRQVQFSDDGTKLFILGVANDTIYQYNLSVAWDLSTATYSAILLYTPGFASESIPVGLFFGDSGQKIYLSGLANDRVYQINLSTAWDLSSAGSTGKTLNVGSLETLPYGLGFSSDGTKLFVGGSSSDRIYQYTLSTAWDLATASYDSVSLNIAAQDNSIQAFYFNTIGDRLYIAGDSTDRVHQYNLSIPWNLSTALYADLSFDFSAQLSAASGISFNTDGSKMYLLDISSDAIYQYSSGS